MKLRTVQLLNKLFGMTVEVNDGKVSKINFFN